MMLFSKLINARRTVIMKHLYCNLIVLPQLLFLGCQPRVLSRDQLEHKFAHEYRGFWSYIGTTNGYHYVEQHIPMSKRNYYKLPIQEFQFSRTIPPSTNRWDWEPLFSSSGLVQVAISVDRVPYFTELTNGNVVVRIDYLATGEEKTRRVYLLGPNEQRTPLENPRGHSAFP